MRTHTRALLAALTLAALPRCAKDPTGIFLTIYADDGVAREARGIVVNVFHGTTVSNPVATKEFIYITSGPVFPLTLNIGVANPGTVVRVEVRAYRPPPTPLMRAPAIRDFNAFVEDRMVVTARANTFLDVDIILDDDCVHMDPTGGIDRCPSLDQTCSGEPVTPTNPSRCVLAVDDSPPAHTF